MSRLSESDIEEAALEWFAGLDYAVLHGPDIGPEGPAPERGSYDEVLLTGRLRKALARLNPNLPTETLEDVLRKVRQAETPSLVEENRRLHTYLIAGVPVEVAREDGSMSSNAALWVRARERVAGAISVPLPLLGIVIVNAMMLAWTMLGLILGAAHYSLDDPDRFRLFANIAILAALIAAGFVRGRMTRTMWVTALVAALAYGVLLPLLAG